MNVACGNCPAKYAVPDAKVKGKKVRIQCKRCGAAIVIDGTQLDAVSGGEQPPPAPIAAEPRAPRAPSVAPPAAPPARPRPAQSAAPAPKPPRRDSPPRHTTQPEPKRPEPTLVSAQSQAAPAALRPRAKQTMIGLPPPSITTRTEPAREPAPVERPAPPSTGQRVVVSARGPATEQPGQAPPAPRRAAKATIIGGMQAPAFSSGAAAPAQLSERPWVAAVTEGSPEQLSTDEIVAFFAVGKIKVDTLIWKPGTFAWKKPFDIPEIASALRAKGHSPEGRAARAAATLPSLQTPGEARTDAEPAKLPEPSRSGVDIDPFGSDSLADADEDDAVTRAIDSPFALNPETPFAGAPPRIQEAPPHPEPVPD
ncbi:MAG TPA: zinc-ribbon domain-containing protein, partial [Polyangiaceae bacterium]